MSISLFGSNIANMFKSLIEAGADPIKDDYILVIGEDVELMHVYSPVQIVRDPQANGSAYLVQRKNYYQQETN